MFSAFRNPQFSNGGDPRKLQEESDEDEFSSLIGNYAGKMNGGPQSSNMPSENGTTSDNENSSATIPRSDPQASSSSTNDDDKFIAAVNGLQKHFQLAGEDSNVPLPEIAVVGDQSQGKSSLLERIVGQDFLPKGQDVVTKTPIVIQLHKSDRVYAKFLHKRNEEFTDFKKVQKEIQEETSRLCSDSGFSRTKICLEVFSPNVLDLTLVDLPGVIKSPPNSLPATAAKVVEEIVSDYIKSDNVLILYVCRADVPMANSQAVTLVKSVDPESKRTIGVLTHCDRIQQGIDPLSVFNRRDFLNKDFIGVVNRSESEQNWSKQQMDEHERRIFSEARYKDLRHRMGTPFLIDLLQDVLKTHIQTHIEAVRSNIYNKRCKYKAELKELEDSVGRGPSSELYFINKMVQKFSSELKIHLMGYSENVPTHELTAGAMINKFLSVNIYAKMNALSLIPDEKALKIISLNIAGIRGSLGPENPALIASTQTLLNNFKLPMEESLQKVKNLLFYAVEKCSSQLDGYTEIKTVILHTVKDWIEEEAKKTSILLGEILEMEEHINYNHPDFKLERVTIPSVGPQLHFKSEEIKTDESKGSVPTKHSSAAATDAEQPSSTSQSTGAAENRLGSPSSSQSSFNAELEMQNIMKNLEGSEPMDSTVIFLKTIVLKYINVVSMKLTDSTVKALAHFLCKKSLDRVLLNLGPTMMSPDMMNKLKGAFKSDFQRIQDLKVKIKIMTEALESIEGF